MICVYWYIMHELYRLYIVESKLWQVQIHVIMLPPKQLVYKYTVGLTCITKRFSILTIINFKLFNSLTLQNSMNMIWFRYRRTVYGKKQTSNIFPVFFTAWNFHVKFHTCISYWYMHKNANQHLTVFNCLSNFSTDHVARGHFSRSQNFCSTKGTS